MRGFGAFGVVVERVGRRRRHRRREVHGERDVALGEHRARRGPPPRRRGLDQAVAGVRRQRRAPCALGVLALGSWRPWSRACPVLVGLARRARVHEVVDRLGDLLGRRRDVAAEAAGEAALPAGQRALTNVCGNSTSGAGGRRRTSASLSSRRMPASVLQVARRSRRRRAKIFDQRVEVVDQARSCRPGPWRGAGSPAGARRARGPCRRGGSARSRAPSGRTAAGSRAGCRSRRTASDGGSPALEW